MDNFEDILLEIIGKLAEGKQVDIEGYCNKYPQHRDALLAKFRTAEFLRKNFHEEDLTGKRLGEYLILQELGRGGMGIVFLGIHPTLSRLTAIKVLPPHFIYDNEALRHFQEEAKTIAKFNHPNIVPIYSISDEKGLYYIAMGYIPGPSLREIIAKLQPHKAHELKADFIKDIVQEVITSKKDILQKSIALKRDERFWNKSYFHFVGTIGSEIADALNYAHQNGIFHGDLKPTNILFTHDGIPMIVDFGLSRDIKQSSSSKTADFAGTLAYAAPEQIKTNVINEKTDIWALGVTLYELLTFKHPFLDNTVKKTTDKILKACPLPLRHYNKKIPIELEAIVLKCLESKPENRYKCVADLSNDLKNYLESRPIKAKPDNILKRTKKAIIRRPARVIAIIFLILSFLIFSYFGIEQLFIKDFEAIPRLLFVEDKVSEAEIRCNRFITFGKFFPTSKKVINACYDFFIKYYYHKGDYDNAVTYYKNLIKQQPQNTEAYLQLGLLYITKRDYSNAAVYLKKTIEINPQNADGHYYLGLFYVAKGDYENAIRHYEKIIEIDPKDIRGYNELHAYYYLQKNYDKAIAYLEKIIQIDPKNTDAYYWLGNYYFIKKDDEKAIEIYKRGYDTTYGDDPNLDIGIGLILYEKGFREADKEKIISYLLDYGFSNEQITNIYRVFKYSHRIDETIKDLKAYQQTHPDVQQKEIKLLTEESLKNDLKKRIN